MKTSREATLPWGNPYDTRNNDLPRIVQTSAAALLAEFDATFDTGLQAVSDVRTGILSRIINGTALDRDEVMAAARAASLMPGRRKPYVAQDTCHAPVVYYAQLAHLVKIGWTTNITLRMRTLNPERVLATEPGDNTLEHSRHQHFADVHYHGEWYRHEGQLAAWINLLNVTGASPCAT